MFYKRARHAKNPGKIWVRLFENFLKNGGKFLRLDIKDLNFDESKPVIRSETQRFIFDKLVIACGAFSKKLTDKLHENITLDTERGYHIHFKGCEHLITRPVVFQNRGFGMTPLVHWFRVVVTVVFGGLINPLSISRIKSFVNYA